MLNILTRDLIRISGKRIRAYLDTIISMYFFQLMFFLNLLPGQPYLSLLHSITRLFVIDYLQIWLEVPSTKYR